MSLTDDSAPSQSAAPSSRPGVARSPFRWRQQWEFIRKELRETLRDRRTIITLLAMPILLYPLLGLGFRFMAVKQLAMVDEKIYVGIENENDAAWVTQVLRASVNAEDAKRAELGEAVSEKAPEIVLTVPKEKAEIDLKKMVTEGVVDVGIRVNRNSAQRPTTIQNPAKVELIYNRDQIRGERGADVVAERLELVNQSLIRQWAQSRRIEFEFPIQQQRTGVQGDAQTSAILGLLPLVLLLMTVTGGVYPAIDLTAGERERNTLETLMALPVPRIRLLLAKFVAVVTVTMLTGIMNLLAMSITLYSLQLDTILLGASGFTLVLAGKLFLILFAFALFYSAVLLLLTSSARSFKEAQAYLIPLLLLSIGPGLVILLPGWSLGQGTAVLPLVNILLLSKEVLEGTAELLPALVAILSTILYGIAALSLAAQVFGNDAVAVGSRSAWRDLFQRPTESTAFPSMPSALVGLALLFPAYFVVSGIVSRGAEVSPSYRMALSGMLTVALFLGFPVLLLRWQNVRIRSGLGLNLPKLAHLMGAVLIGLSAWPFVYELVLLSQMWGLGGPDLSRFEQVKTLLEGWAKIPLAVVLLTLAVAPGVCEEAFFRGFLFGGVRRSLGPAMTILVTGIAFALFHIVLAGGAAPERLLPSFLMGLVLGWVRHRSGSVIPGMVLHVLHNSSLLTIAHYRQELEGWGVGGQHETHLPIQWLAGAGAGMLVGLAMMLLTRQQGDKGDSLINDQP